MLFPFIVIGQDMGKVKADIDSLCSNKANGRGYVLNGDKIAAKYISDRFLEVGLSSFKADFYQKFSLNVNTFPSNITFSTNKTTLKTGIDFIPNPSCGNVKGKFKIIQLDSALLADKAKFLKLKTKKKALFIPEHLVQKIINKNEEDRMLKAYSFPLLITEKEKLVHGYSSVQSGREVVVKKGLITKSDKKVNVEIAPNYLEKYVSQNVIGFLPGNVYPDSFIVVCAHYDHLGSIGNQAIFRGASDNASGVAFMLSLAEYFGKQYDKNKYSMVFIAFGGEESGLVGSKFFVENPYFPIRNTALVLNFDLMGTGDEGITVVNATVFKSQFEKLKNLNAQHEFLPKVNPRGKTAHSDHHYFTEKGIKSFFIYTQKGHDYYHDIKDTPESLPLQGFKGCFDLVKTYIEAY
jgi:aminopeptidase YwaD